MATTGTAFFDAKGTYFKTREEATTSDLAALLGVSGEPVFTRHHVGPHAIPQYNLGHERHLDTMSRCEQAHHGLFIGSNSRDGISLPDCATAGLRLAKKAIA